VTFKDKLIWLKGKKVAVCETDHNRLQLIKSFLERYDIEVAVLSSAEEMKQDLESRRYSTHRVFFAVFVAADLAREMEQPWQNIINMNPSLLKTPLIMTASPEQKVEAEDLIEAGYFRHCLTHPISANDMLRVLRRLNRWNAMRGDTKRAAQLDK